MAGIYDLESSARGATAVISQLLDFIDNRQVVRRVVLIVAIHMTYAVTYWSMGFAETSTRTGLDLAALIAAVTAPVTAFAGFVFKLYLDAKGEMK